MTTGNNRFIMNHKIHEVSKRFSMARSENVERKNKIFEDFVKKYGNF